jgi:AraC-like DNA-binding protein
MEFASTFTLHPGWRLLLRDLGIRPANVLRRAGLPEDLLTREAAQLSTAQFFNYWRGLEEEVADPTLPILICEAVSIESFDAPLFAAMCSPNLNVAVQRVSCFKRLLGPMALHVEITETRTTIGIEFLDKTLEPPIGLVAMELVFFVQIARLATREKLLPLAITTPEPPQPAAAYTTYFGRAIEAGPLHTVTFAARDAMRPFLTANAGMWDFFEPELRKRLCELDETATMFDRVRGALLELLPSGSASLQAVAAKLAVSTRTLQRRLQAEGQRFQLVLDSTREELARHYLKSSTLSGSEISFLLGFEDPNSFFRAFQHWTGQTPEQIRTTPHRSPPPQ